ncbi:MAG: 16S rRNA (adenine(1518)-N(6)/adenine(1519)-N(6))-dimethyltransferase RsmA [bacterium]
MTDATTDSPHRARKRFGQHFLTDRAVLARMVAAFAPAGGQRIVEIGPGRGALTDALMAHQSAAARDAFALSAIEIDRDLARRLAQRYLPEQATIIQADILAFDLRDAHADAPDARLRLIGNLPYNIATQIIFRLMTQAARIEDMLFMLQREVALRLCAPPGGQHRGRLSVMAEIALEREMLFDVPPRAFAPPPKVDSTLVHLRPKTNPLTALDRATLDAVVVAAFSQRRKTLRNALSELARERHFIRADVDPSLRAETLSAEAFIALADAVANDAL